MTQPRHCLTSLLASVALIAALCGGARHAMAEDSRPRLSVNGYGTIGIAVADDSAYWEEFHAGSGGEHSRHWSLDQDSRLGLQLTAQFSDRLSAVVQVISEYRYDNTYSPEVEWANLQYQVNDNFSVRVGRIRQPVFMFADSRKVGYTYPWVRLPAELYTLVAASRNDGVDISYSRRFGEARNTLNLTVGESDFYSPGLADAGKSSARRSAVLMNRLEYGHGTLFASYSRTDLTIPGLSQPFDSFRAFGTQGQAVAARYSVDDALTDYFSVGLNYDPGRWFATGEWATLDSDSILVEGEIWYLSAGYRVGDVTPYVMYSRQDTGGDTFRGLNLAALPEAQRAPAAALNEGFENTLGASYTQHTSAIGLRWDLISGIALKVQYERLYRSRPGLGSDSRTSSSGNTDLFSATIDFVF